MSIELSSAILIVGGAFAAISTLAAASADPGMLTAGAAPVVGLLIVLNVLTVIVGLLVRRGTAWILCTNVAAVVLFVELTGVPSGGAFAAGLAALDAFVFISLMRNRPWFDWRPPSEGPRR